MKAFPTLADNGHAETQDGMDLRDYFAAKAMHAIILAIAKDMKKNPFQELSEISYKFADAMMEARKK